MNFDIAVKNKEGDNLINNINFENIEVKYLINNQIVSGQKPLLIEDDEDTRIRVFLNNYPPNGFPITYVKWNEIDTDTIKAKFFYNQDVVNQIWFNDSLVTPIINSKNFYTIVKN